MQQQQCGNCSSSGQKCISSETVRQGTGRHLRHATYRLCCHSESNYTFPPIGLSLKSNKISVKGVLAPGEEVLIQMSPHHRGNLSGRPESNLWPYSGRGTRELFISCKKNMHTLTLDKRLNFTEK